MIDIGQLRKEFQDERLLEKDLLDDPYDQFEIWFNDACKAQVPTPNAMALCTIDPEGMPRSRTVLLRKIERNGFTFFTRYDSKKALHIEKNPRVALHFHWKELNREVTISGILVKTSVGESRSFFSSCNRRLRLAARLPKYPSPVDYSEMEEKLESLDLQYDGTQIPMPEWWGGYRIQALRFEFWQGRSNYLHDRFKYCLCDSDGWKRQRMAP